MEKRNYKDLTNHFETLEELIAFEDKIEKLGSETRKSLNANSYLNVNEYLASIDKLVDEHKNNIQHLIYSNYQNIQESL